MCTPGGRRSARLTTRSRSYSSSHSVSVLWRALAPARTFGCDSPLKVGRVQQDWLADMMRDMDSDTWAQTKPLHRMDERSESVFMTRL